MTRALLCLALVGCGTDPHLKSDREALRAWDDAQAADAPADRQAALERALSHDPGSVALRRSLACELGTAGGYAEAIAALDAVIPAEPTVAHRDAIWDRGALHARAGDLPRAAADVERCIQLGTDPRALGADPAFAVLSAHAEYAHLLPKPSIRATEPTPSPKVLVGEAWRRTVQVGGPPGDLMVAAVGPFPPGMVLTEVVEDVQSADDYHVARELRFEWRLSLPGNLHVPSIQLAASDLSTALAPVTVEVVALGSTSPKGALPVASPRLPVPSTFDAMLGSTHGPDLPDARVVQAPAHWSCSLKPVPIGAVRLIRREKGQPRWSGWLVPAGTDAVWSCPDQGISRPLR